MGDRDEMWELIHLINAKLERAKASGDLAAALTSADFEETRRLASLQERADADDIDMVANARHLLGTLRWYRHQLASGGTDDDHVAAVSYFTLPFIMGLDDIPEALLPDLADHAMPTATSWQRSAAETRAGDQIDHAFELWQRIADHLRPDHPGRTAVTANLGSLLMLRFEDNGSPQDLDRSIEMLEAAAADTTSPRQREDILSTLVNALRTRLKANADPADLDRMIDHLAAGASVAADETRTQWLYGRADSLLIRFDRDGDNADLDQAIDALRTALAADRTDGHPPTALRYDLAYALARRFNHSRSRTDLAEAIDIASAAATTAAPDDVFKAPAQSLLDDLLRATHKMRPG
ncbi:hypothetical protein GCM10010191_20240 [Actinomadura vinacea]|uniref:Tetratricopeptide repeat protein n=1 Tax=Actinomadura vinacea TaxID=115336 RepID=A0ABN3ISA7_9ACTN